MLCSYKKEQKVAESFNLPTFWTTNDVEYLKTKSGNRYLLNGVTNIPKGYGDLYSIDDVVNATLKLYRDTGIQKNSYQIKRWCIWRWEWFFEFIR